MQKIYMISEDSHVINHWRQSDLNSQYRVEILPSIDMYLEDHVKSFENRDDIVFLHIIKSCPPITKITELVRHAFNVIIFSNQPNAQEALPLFKVGIKGYLNTFANPVRVQQALTTIKAGNIWLGQDLLNSMISQADSQQHARNIEKPVIWSDALTEREIETAEQILKGKSNLEIAETMNISERTVKKYVQSLLAKYEVKDRLALVLKIGKMA